MILNSMYKNGGILAIFALATTGSVSLIHALTKDLIIAQEQQYLMQVLTEVVPSNLYDNKLHLNCTTSNAAQLGPDGPHTIYRGYLKGQPSVLLIQHRTSKGYSGNIDILSAVSAHGKVQGVRVTSHKETPGLGDKVELTKSLWITHFKGTIVQSEQDSSFAVKKDGGKFDQFTGATITPRAVVNSVKDATWFAKEHFDSLFSADNQCEESKK